MNDGGNKERLGLKMVNDHKLKCYAQGLEELPDYDEELDIKNWETANAKSIDLKYMAFCKFLNTIFSAVLILNL